MLLEPSSWPLLSHDSLDYERKLVQQGLELIHDIPIDDNLDGQYSGAVVLKLSGTYRLNITLDGLEIQGSPFELHVNATNSEPTSLFLLVWRLRWEEGGIHPAVQGFGGLLQEDEVEGWSGDYITAAQGDVIAFTVSCRDKYGNKCSATDHAGGS